MFKSAFFTFIYEPLYNGLIFLVDIMPWHDVGIAVIVLTIAVKVVLLPLSRQMIRTQVAMRATAPEIEEIKKRLKDKPEEQAREIFALYRERGIRPFSSILTMFLQLPIILGLYWVFWRGGLPDVDPTILYSFVAMPEMVNMEFLGLIDMGQRSALLAVLTGLSQIAYMRLSMGPRTAPVKEDKPSLSSDMMRSFDLQVRYVLPLVVTGISFTLAAAVPLYWTTSNLFIILQEFAMGKRFREQKSKVSRAESAAT